MPRHSFSPQKMAFSQIIKHSTKTLDNLLHSSIFVKTSPINSHHQSSNQTLLFHLHPKTFCNKPSPHELTHQPITDPDHLCKLITTHNDPSHLHSFLTTTQIHLSHFLVTQVLKKLTNAGVLALSFFKWAEKQPGFKHSSDTYNELIEALGKIKQFKIIWALVSEMKVKNVLDKTTFGIICRRYARAKKVKEAVETFEKMEKFGFKVELSDYNRFLDTLCKSWQVECAQSVFDKMKKKGGFKKPDIKTYGILLEGWCQERNLLKLDECFREMKGDGFEPDVVVYGIVVNAYCKAKKYDEAVRKFEEMRLKKLEPSPHIYCSLINGLGSQKRLSEALGYFELSKSSGHGVDGPTYNAVVGAYCWAMKMDEAFRVMEEMRGCGVGPNSRTFDIVLHHLVKGGRREEAYGVFRRMRDEFGCDPSVSTYEIMVRMFCNEGRMDMAVKIWEEMKGEGVLPGMHMFATLINGLCREKKLQDACKYFEEMLDMGIRPPTHMFNKLKQALVDEGKEDIVMTLTHRLEKLKTLLVVS